MKRISEYLFFWTLGGCIYYSIEMVFRGFSHWSMFVLGGFCMLFLLYRASGRNGESLSGDKCFGVLYL